MVNTYGIKFWHFFPCIWSERLNGWILLFEINFRRCRYYLLECAIFFGECSLRSTATFCVKAIQCMNRMVFSWGYSFTLANFTPQINHSSLEPIPYFIIGQKGRQLRPVFLDWLHSSVLIVRRFSSTGNTYDLIWSFWCCRLNSHRCAGHLPSGLLLFKVHGHLPKVFNKPAFPL